MVGKERSVLMSTNSNLLRLKDNRNCFRVMRDALAAAVKEVRSRWMRRYNPLRADAKSLFPSLETVVGSDGITMSAYPPLAAITSSKLIVLIHGLNSSLLAWTEYLTAIKRREPDASCFVPFVLDRGYCPLEDAAVPILRVVQDYVHQYPDNPVIIIGHSNGGRIAAHIEQELEAVDVRLVSISAPHGGCKIVNWLTRFGLCALFGLHPAMVRELTYGGPWVSASVDRWQRMARNENRTRVTRCFFASCDDWRVFPYETSFPILPNSTYRLVSGESHVTIIDAVRDRVLSFIGLETKRKFHLE